ncbi:MAG: MFS transporter [Chloroflexi bacterium]|nr:MFS transporter [Chloroflexota bacterium]
MLKVSLRPGNLSVGSLRIHYAWVIVGVASVMWTITSAVRFAPGVLVPYFQDLFGWSIFGIFGVFALQWIFAALFSPIAGWIGDRYGIRRVMVLGAVIFLVGMMLTGTMTHLWQFYLYFGVILAASMAIFQVPLLAAVTLWFKTRLGVAMGTLQSLPGLGTGVAIVLVPLLFTLGLNWTFWLPGLVGAALMLLLLRLFHNEPGAIGLKPLGASDTDPLERLQEGRTAKVRSSVFLQHAQRTNAFWNLIGIHFWGCAGHNIILMGLAAMAVERGISIGAAAGVYGALTIVSSLTRFLVPVAADRFGSKGVMAVSFALQSLPVLMLLVAHDLWVFYLFAVLFGIGVGGEMTAFPVINRQYYGHGPMGTTYGWQTLGGGMGMALGLVIGGFIWTQTGNYTASVWLSFGLSLVGVISIVALPNTAHHLIPHWEESLPPEARSSAALQRTKNA